MTLVAATIGLPALTVAAAADDQARLDAAIEAFNERMTAAGWESQGPAEGSGADGDDEVSAGDDVATECLDELAVLFENLDADEFPGQVASNYSDEFTYAPITDASSTTAEFSLDVTEETAAAFSVSVDDANVATATQFIEFLGAKDTADCVRQALEAAMAAEAEGADPPIEFEINVSSEADLGIGDHSAALGYEISTVFIVPITIDIEVALAQAGNDIVGVVHTVTGEQTSGFDPRAELQTIVDSLEG